jgi:hypothetical protein
MEVGNTPTAIREGSLTRGDEPGHRNHGHDSERAGTSMPRWVDQCMCESGRLMHSYQGWACSSGMIK